MIKLIGWMVHPDRFTVSGLRFPKGVSPTSRSPIFCDEPFSVTVASMETNFTLRFDPDEISQWAEKYNYGSEKDQAVEKRIIEHIGPRAAISGVLGIGDFREICRWKSQRSQKHCAKSDPEFVKDITSTALSAKNERTRIEVLTLLDGVGWPTASVILHFCSKNQYPILDFRALWSLSSEQPKAGYAFNFWWRYVEFCRMIAAETKVSMRTLDRALWAYSAKNQLAEAIKHSPET